MADQAGDGAHDQTLGLRLGDLRVRVRASAADAAVIRSTFADDLDPDPATAPHELVVGRAGDRPVLTFDGALWAPGEVESVADQVVYLLLRATLDHEPHLLHLHAAMVATGGVSLLLAGLPQSGKSTLTAQLVEEGFDYFTDERVGLDADLSLHPLPKPVSLAPGSFGPLAHLDPRRTGHGAASQRLWHVPAAAIRLGAARTDPSTTPLAAVVFVERRPDVIVATDRLHPATAARLLLADSVDAVRLGAPALDRAARLCTSVPCVRLTFGDPHAAAHQLRTLATPPPSPGDEIQSLPDPRGPLRLAADVTGLVVAGRCLLHRNRSGQVLELDEVGSIWLQLLLDGPSMDAVVTEVAKENDMKPSEVEVIARQAVDGLRREGLLR